MTALTSPHRTVTAASGAGWSPRLSGRAPLILSVVALALAVVFLITGLASLVVSAFAGGIGDEHPKQAMNRLLEEHGKSMEQWQAQFNNRSAFFKPPAPPAPPLKVEAPVEVPISKVDTTPVIDPVYRGPSVAFAVGETIYFNPPSSNEKYLRVRVGEEASGVRVISTSLPWSVKLGYKGGEYEVPIFNRAGEGTFLSTNVTKTPGFNPFMHVVTLPQEGDQAQPDQTDDGDVDQAAMASGEGTPEPRRGSARAVARRNMPQRGAGPVADQGGEIAQTDVEEADEIADEDADEGDIVDDEDLDDEDEEEPDGGDMEVTGSDDDDEEADEEGEVEPQPAPPAPSPAPAPEPSDPPVVPVPVPGSPSASLDDQHQADSAPASPAEDAPVNEVVDDQRHLDEHVTTTDDDVLIEAVPVNTPK